jgi:hypothetical protein
MNTSLFTNFRSYTAYGGLPSRALDLGNAYSASNKTTLNRTISENTLRKATQLVEDLAAINSKTRDFQNPGVRPKDNKLTPVQFAEQQLENSIQNIKDLRLKLGIETPFGSASKNDILQTLLKQDRGTLFDTTS